MTKLSPLAAAAMLVVASRAPAQTFSDAAAYAALMRTAVAGLPPIATSTILGERQNGAAFSARYGNVAVRRASRSPRARRRRRAARPHSCSESAATLASATFR